MKVVVLAAGRSVRMQPIKDKNLLTFLGRPLLTHQLAALKEAGFKDMLVVGGKHNLTAFRHCIAELKKEPGAKTVKIAMREQKDLDLGMAGAVLTAASWIKKEPFLVVSANDVVDPSVFKLVQKSIRANEGLLVAKKVSSYFPGGYLKVGAKNRIRNIVEKPGAGKEPSKLVNLVVHYHPQPRALFDALEKISTDRDDRYERVLQALFNDSVVYRAVSFSGFWQPLKYPWHILDLTEYFLSTLATRFPKGRIGGKKAEVAKSARIFGDVHLADGVRVMDNAVIQGPAYIGKNTVVATNALVRSSHIGENCVIGFGSEVARSHLGNNVWTHTNYIGDSVIGNDVSFGAGAVTGNLRLDEREIFVNVKGEKTGTGRTKLGLITGDHIRAGINTSFMPGVKVCSDSFVGAGITVARDIEEGSYVTGEWQLKVRKNREKISPRITL